MKSGYDDDSKQLLHWLTYNKELHWVIKRIEETTTISDLHTDLRMMKSFIELHRGQWIWLRWAAYYTDLRTQGNAHNVKHHSLCRVHFLQIESLFAFYRRHRKQRIQQQLKGFYTEWRTYMFTHIRLRTLRCTKQQPVTPYYARCWEQQKRGAHETRVMPRWRYRRRYGAIIRKANIPIFLLRTATVLQ